MTGAFVSVLQELVGHAAVDRVRGDVGGGGPGARHLQAELYQQGNCTHNIACHILCLQLQGFLHENVVDTFSL